MRATIHTYSWAIISTKAHRDVVTMMAKGCMYCDLSTASEVFLILLPNYIYIHVYAITMQ